MGVWSILLVITIKFNCSVSLRYTGILMLQTFNTKGDSNTYIGDAPEDLIQEHQYFNGGRRIICVHVHYSLVVAPLSVLWLMYT